MSISEAVIDVGLGLIWGEAALTGEKLGLYSPPPDMIDWLMINWSELTRPSLPN
jgi:hypothetical protein